MDKNDPLSRRGLIRSGVATAAVAALSSCNSVRSPTSTKSPTSATFPTSTGSLTGVGANVRVSDDPYVVHVEPSVAANPLRPLQLMAACQVSPTSDPQFLACYLSFDGGDKLAGGWPTTAACGRDEDWRRRDCRLRWAGPRLRLRHLLRRRPCYLHVADRRRRAHLLGAGDLAGRAVLRSSLVGRRSGADSVRAQRLRCLGRRRLKDGSGLHPLHRRRKELRATTHNPGGGRHPLGSERRPGACRRTAWAGLRRLLLDNPAGLVGRHDRPGRGSLLDRWRQ